MIQVHLEQEGTDRAPWVVPAAGVLAAKGAGPAPPRPGQAAQAPAHPLEPVSAGLTPIHPSFKQLHHQQATAIEQQHQQGPKPGLARLTGIHRGEDGQGQGLGLAGDVARQHQGGAEFPQGPGKTEAHPGHQARHGQGQDDLAQNSPLTGPQAAGHLGQGFIDLLQGRQGGAHH